MWQKEKKDSSIVSLAFLLTLATSPMAATLVMPDSTLAKSLETGERLVANPRAAKRAIAEGMSQTVVTAEIATNTTVSSSDSQGFVSFTNKNEIQTLLKWLLLPVSVLGGLLLWWLLKRQKDKDPHTDKVMESASNMPMSEALSMGTLGASEADQVENMALGATSTLSNSEEVAVNDQPPTTEGRATYSQLPSVWSAQADSNVQTPQMPDVWEAESDVKLPSTEVTTNSEQLESDKVTLDLQAPRVVVNTSSAEVADISEVAFHLKPRVTVVTIPMTQETSRAESNGQEIATDGTNGNSRLTDDSDTNANNDTQQLNIYADNAAVGSDVTPQAIEVSHSEVALDLEAPAAVVTTSYPEFLDNAAVASDVQPLLSEDTASFVELPNVSQVELDMVADAAELTTEETEEVVQTEPTSASVSYTAATTVIASGAAVGKWAATDGIEETHESNLKLETKITEVAAPVVEEESAESKLADVDSSIVLTPRTPKWAYVFWNVSEAQKEPLRQSNGSQLVLRMYDVTDIDLSDRTPQHVQQYECEETTHNRYVAIPLSDRDYMAEIGYVTDDARWLLLARSATVRVKSRPEPDFWFVADAELIIHGATEPGSTVSLGGHPIKLKSDGTFHLRIPFTDSLIDYLMEAVAANGEQAKKIHMKFSQEAPETNS